MDGFHHPRAHRHRQGRVSGIGYYQDAYDLESLAHMVLVPLGAGGDLRYRPRIIDLERDEIIEEWATAPRDSVLIVDGTFLQRDELAGLWDEVVYLDTGFEVARARGIQRDAARLGSDEAAGHLFDQRYHIACRMYVEEIGPLDRSTIVITNDDIDRPVLRRIGGNASDRLRLFSYGTLRQAEVQLSNFGRHLVGTPDLLPGYRTDWVTIADPEVIAASGSDRHPIVRHTGHPDDVVSGTAFEITPAELAAADTYEVDDYRRVLVRLDSGVSAWVYIAAERP
jgi:hypothetical protein